MTDAYADVAIRYFDGEAELSDASAPLPSVVTARTRGLEARGHAELEVVNVPAAFRAEAAMLLSTAAGAAVERRAIVDGRLWASRIPDGFLVAANVKKMPSGVLRLLDIEGTDVDAPARTPLCAMAVSRSRILKSQEPEKSEAILRNALDWFPGEPGDGLAFANDELCNQNNSLAYLARSEQVRSIDDEEALFLKAAERSRSLRLAEIGGPLPEPLERNVLLADISGLVTLLQAASKGGRDGWGAPPPRGMTFLFSPILRIDGEGMRQSLAIGMPAFRNYYFEGPVSEQLRTPNVRELVAAIYERWAQEPLMALVRSCDTARGIYESGYRFDEPPPKRPFVFRGRTDSFAHVPFLSRLLAAVGRELAAGITLDEMRARWGLMGAEGLAQAQQKSASEKLNALRRAEDMAISGTYD